MSSNHGCSINVCLLLLLKVSVMVQWYYFYHKSMYKEVIFLFNFHLLEWLELPKALTPRQTVVFFRHAFYKAINKLVKYRKELSVESKYWWWKLCSLHVLFHKFIKFSHFLHIGFVLFLLNLFPHISTIYCYFEFFYWMPFSFFRLFIAEKENTFFFFGNFKIW